MNFMLLRCLNLLGTRIHFDNKYTFKENVTHIIIANHQSHNDIPGIIWHLRKLHPKFISKKELAIGIPSVSYNLRHGGSILIDRKNPRQSIPEIKKFAQYLIDTKRSAVIFPEGTRSRTGMPGKFSPSGLKLLFKLCPDAVVVPVTINNSWKLERYGMFPMNIGVKLNFEVQKPIRVNEYETETLIQLVEQEIVSAIKN